MRKETENMGEAEECITGADGTRMLRKYLEMPYTEIELLQKNFREGKVTFAISKRRALEVAASWRMKKQYRWAIKFWSYVHYLLFIAAIPALFLIHWIASIGLIATSLMIGSANKKSAANFIKDYALESKEFLKYALANEIIEIQEEG